MTTQSKKKELEIRMQPNGHLYSIAYKGGGEIPKELSGGYTSRRVARIRIDHYLNKRDGNATSKKTSRSK